MLRTPLASERLQRIDPATGLKVIQLTSYPSPSVAFNYNWPSVTPDGGRLMFACQRAARRDAPWDLFRCDADGLNLFQLAEREIAGVPWHYGIPKAIMTLDGATIYSIWPSEHILCRVDVETGETEELVALGEHVREGALAGTILITGDEKRLFISIPSYEHGGSDVLRVSLETGEVFRLDMDATVQAVFPDRPRLLVSKNHQKLGAKTTADGTRVYTNLRDEKPYLASVDEDGGDEQYVGEPIYAHMTMLGKTGDLQGTGYAPHRCIWMKREGEEPEKLCQGPYFWHSGASWDGEWIVSDTNWPDEGVKLVHVPTGNFRTMCHAGASQEHSQFGHLHPALSQDGRLAVFTSDRTGVSQVYVVHITDEFRQSVIEGGVDQPRDKWM